ncbi:MAG: class I SAM-dependent methyltransferase [Promethearchaeota archaeon]
MSDEYDFEKDYFEGEQSIFWKVAGYEFLIKLNRWRLKKFRKVIINYATHHKTLLDIGCAYGHFLDLLKNDFIIHGTDISHHATKVAKFKLKIPVKQANIEEEFPFDKNFDIITALDVIEHLNNPKKAIKNIYNHLNDGGLFFFQLPTVSSKISSLINKIIFNRDKTHTFIVSVEEVERVVKSAGFKKLTIYSSLFPIFTKKEKFVKDFCTVFGVFEKS